MNISGYSGEQIFMGIGMTIFAILCFFCVILGLIFAYMEIRQLIIDKFFKKGEKNGNTVTGSRQDKEAGEQARKDI